MRFGEQPQFLGEPFCLHIHALTESAPLLGRIRSDPTMMAATGRTLARRAVPRHRTSGVLVVETVAQTALVSGKPKHAKAEWDGTRPQGWCGGFIHDGKEGFFEHQPGFLRARVRC